MIEKTIDIYDATSNDLMPMGVSIFESIAEKHGVKKGEYIRDKQKFRDIFIDNCHHVIAICLDEEFENA